MDRHKLDYLKTKKDRTVAETVMMIRELLALGTNPEDRLMIAYREAGMFRRVITDAIAVKDLTMLLDAADRGAAL